MNLVDANVLLYAVNEADPKHSTAHTWLDRQLSGQGTVGFAWIVVLAFLRLSTRAGLFPRPLGITDSIGVVRSWLASPSAIVVHETPRHFDVLAELLEATGAGGNLATDAHLAALAIEHHADVVTFDSDFGRFPRLRSAPPDRA